MIEMSLHAAPRWRDVVLEQVRVVGLSLRREALVVAVVLGIGTLLVASELAGGGPGFDSYQTFPTALISFLFPFAVWRGEKRFGPGFLWSLPVDRRRLALARVFAGWVWMMATLAFFIAWVLVLGLFAHASPAHTIMRVPLTATIAAYLFGSALLLGLRHPLRWLLGVAGGSLVLTTFTEMLGRTGNGEWRIVSGSSALRWAFYGPYGLRTLLGFTGFFSTVQDSATAGGTLPDLTQWAFTTIVWIGAGLALLWLAASRHRETRRH